MNVDLAVCYDRMTINEGKFDYFSDNNYEQCNSRSNVEFLLEKISDVDGLHKVIELRMLMIVCRVMVISDKIICKLGLYNFVLT